MCLKRNPHPFATTCTNCGGHLANIDNGLRECEQCGYLTRQGFKRPPANANPKPRKETSIHVD